jgi:hypothetical protein
MKPDATPKAEFPSRWDELTRLLEWFDERGINVKRHIKVMFPRHKISTILGSIDATEENIEVVRRVKAYIERNTKYAEHERKARRGRAANKNRKPKG